MLDENELSTARPSAISQGWIVTFSDLLALLLAFFVMLYSVSAREASKVDAAVSSVTDEFAKSTVVSEFGTVASKSGIIITDQNYLDAVVTAFRGSDSFGEIEQLRSDGGTLMVRLTRDQLFLPKTGVLRPESISLIEGIASAMSRSASGVALRSMEIRLTATKTELEAEGVDDIGEVLVPIRQASRFSRAMTEAKVPASAISTIILTGKNPSVDLAFYTIAPGGNR